MLMKVLLAWKRHWDMYMVLSGDDFEWDKVCLNVEVCMEKNSVFSQIQSWFIYSKFLSFALLTSGAAQFSVWEAVLCIVGSLATSQSFYTRCQQPAPLNQSCDNQKCLQTLLGVP